MGDLAVVPGGLEAGSPVEAVPAGDGRLGILATGKEYDDTRAID